MKQTTRRIAATLLTTGLTALLLAHWAGAPSRAAAARIQASKAASVPLSGSWKVDPLHTNVNFAVRHMGISTVRGRFDEVSGTIQADAANPVNSSVEITIQAASIDTDVKMRDDHLRSADFFDVAKFPTITFKSTSVRRDRGNRWTARGILTMHGVAREITLPLTLAGPIKDQQAGARIGIEAKTRLNRQDFGIKYGQVLDNGALAIANDVDIEIGLEAIPLKPATEK